MTLIEKWVSEKLEPIKKELSLSFLFTFLWGLAAHGYRFFNNSISHDSIDELLSGSEIIAKKIGSGRFFVPVIHFLRGDVSASWWLGLISLVCLSIAVYLIVRMFSIREKWMICITAGALTVNMTYIATAATYIHDLDCDMVSLLFAVAAAWLWRTRSKGYLWGMLGIALSIGTYQGYVSMAVTLAMMACILDLMHGQSFKAVFWEGLKGIAMLIGGGIVYLILVKATGLVTGLMLSTGTYNSLDLVLDLTPVAVLKSVIFTWISTIKHLLTVNSMYPSWAALAIQVMILGICVIAVCGKLLDKSMKAGEKVLLVILCGLLPIGMNVTRILANGMSTDLMYYAFWLEYVFVFLLLRETGLLDGAKKPKIAAVLEVVAVVLVAAVLWSNLQIANTVYTAKNFIKDANLSMFTRIVSSMEACEEYEAGETPVAFVGRPDGLLDEIPEQFSKYPLIWYDVKLVLGVTTHAHYQCYFDYVLMNPAVIASDDVMDKMESLPEVRGMPVYPREGSIAMMGDTLVVKLGAE